VQGTSRSELERCAQLFEETAAVYAERDGVRTELVTSLLLAAAALGTVETGSPTARLIAATLARDAIEAAERRGLDPTLLLCVAACRRVIELCG
jgi:hypothetical protein